MLEVGKESVHGVADDTLLLEAEDMIKDAMGTQ